MHLRFDANLTWLFTELPFEQRFDAAADAGFGAVEYASPYDFALSMQRRQLDNAGLDLVLINTPSATACVPEQVTTFRSDMERAFEAADVLGAQFVHVVGGVVGPDASVEAATAVYLDNLTWAVAQVQGTGLRLVIEVLNKRDWPGMILRDLAHAAEILDELDSDSIGLMLDFFHAELDEGDAVEAYRRFNEEAFHLQVADSPRRSTPGTGTIQWATLFADIRASGYDGWIGCEYEPSGATLDAFTWMDAVS